MIENAEELWQRCRRLKKEEEEEDRPVCIISGLDICLNIVLKMTGRSADC